MRLSFIRYPEKKLTPPPPPPPLFRVDPNIEIMAKPPPNSDFYVEVGGPNGLGVSLLYKMMFDYLIEHNLVKDIYYTFPQHAFRPDYPRQYHDDLLKLFKTIVPSRCYYIGESDSRCVPWGWDHMAAIFEIPPQRFPLRNTFPRYASFIPVPYVTLNMKVSAISKDSLTWVIPNLISVLNNSKYAVVLVGERSTTPCLEYQLLPDHISIYADVSKKLTRVIDMTYDETCNANSFENIQKSATLYTHSKYNILMNSSGGLGFLCFFGNLIGFTTGCSNWETLMDIQNRCLAHDAVTFINLLAERV
jgi:hypothetical protein